MQPISKFSTAKDYFQYLKQVLLDKGFKVNPYREIQYGLQFMVFWEDESGLIRVYEGKKGLKLDLSQVEDESISHTLIELLEEKKPQTGRVLPFKQTKDAIDLDFLEDLDALIGIDESGKGDYFGPLVVAAVHVHKSQRKALRHLGVADSKTLSDAYIAEIAPEIKALCAHSLVIMANQSYNEIYTKVGNLNHMLAWGHARVLENVLNQVECSVALSDQFGQSHLIQNALEKKGKRIQVYQKPHAESHLAVAAASVLARDSFVNEIQKLQEAFEMNLPKGCSVETLRSAKMFVEKHSKDRLKEVAKLHFKLTDQLEKPED